MAYSPQQVLDAIARIESGGNYTAHSKTSTASGKYQYLDSTWAGYSGYAHAWQAPPAVQDARALHDITDKIHRYGGNINDAIMSWFLPSAVGNPALAGRVPKGNGITPNGYVAKVLGALGAPVPANYSGGATTGTGDTGAAQAGPDMSNLSDPNVQIANLLSILASPSPQETATF